MGRFDGQVVVVTGAGSGIGRATVERLASQGAQVAAADIDVPAAEETVADLPDPSKGFALEVDVSSHDSVRKMVQSVMDRTGGIDVLVNNAGWDRIEPFLDNEPEVWDRILGINLRGTISCTHAVLPHLIDRGGGAIVCVASDAGRVGSSGEVVYSAAKGGIIAFAKAVAREAARHEIRVNCVAPGPTDTPFLEEFEGERKEKILEGMIKATPMRRLAQPQEVADAIAFLASSEARFITGQTLSVSGGLTMA